MTKIRKIRIGYQEFYFAESDLPKVLELLCAGKQMDTSSTGTGTLIPIQFEVLQEYDPDLEAIKTEVKSKYRENLEAEKDKFSRYWMSEMEKSQKLEKRIAELEKMLGDSNA